MYFIVNSSETVVLGGTVQLGNFNGEISEEDKAHILRETALIDPNLEVCSIFQFNFV